MKPQIMDDPGSHQNNLAVYYIFVPVIILFSLFSMIYKEGVLYYSEEGAHLASIAMIMDGKIPYKDFFSQYGLTNDAIPLLFMQITAMTVENFRLYYHVTSILSVVFSYYLSITILRTRWLTLLCLAVLIAETFDPFWSSRWGGMRSGLGLLSLTFLYNFMRSDSKIIWLFLSGLVQGFLLTFSVEIGCASVLSSFLCFALLTVYNSKQESIAPPFKCISVFSLSVAIFTIPSIIFLIYHDALYKMCYLQFFSMPKHILSHQLPFTDIFPQSFLVKSTFKWLGSYHSKYLLPFFVHLLWFSIMVHRYYSKIFTRNDAIIYSINVYGAILLVFSMRGIEGPQFNAAISPSIILGFYTLTLFIRRIPIDQVHVIFNFNLNKFLKRIVCLVLLAIILGYIVFSGNRTFGSTANMMDYLTGNLIYTCSYSKNFSSDLGSFHAAKRSITLSSKYNIEIGKTFREMNNVENLGYIHSERLGDLFLPANQCQDFTNVLNYFSTLPRKNISVVGFPDLGVFNFLLNIHNPTRLPVLEFAGIIPYEKMELLNSLNTDKPRYIIWRHEAGGLERAFNSTGKRWFLDLEDFIRDNYKTVYRTDQSKIEILESKDLT
jgi:hypothetical protein